MLGLGKAATAKDSVLNILSRKNSLLLLLLSLILLIVVIVTIFKSMQEQPEADSGCGE